VLFGIMTEARELKFQDKLPADISAVHCDSVIAFSPILSLMEE
jgi:hypothetical protein